MLAKGSLRSLSRVVLSLGLPFLTVGASVANGPDDIVEPTEERLAQGDNFGACSCFAPGIYKAGELLVAFVPGTDPVRIDEIVASVGDGVVSGCLMVDGVSVTGEKVVLLQAGGHRQETMTDSQGCWSLDLPEPGKRYTVAIRGSALP
jgi:hypothetical protein